MSEEIGIAALAEDGFHLGSCQALLYDPKNTEVFEDGFLGRFYYMCREYRGGSTALLDRVFSGNPSSTFDGIVRFLAQQPLVFVGIWEGSTFHPAGCAFLQVLCGITAPERAAFCGYLFLPRFWGTVEIETLMVLGLAKLFAHFELKAIHGIRYEDNILTKKFTERFGFKLDGVIPAYQLKNGKLVPGVVSTLLREDFEHYVENFLVRELRKARAQEEINAATNGTHEYHALVMEQESVIQPKRMLTLQFLASGEIVAERDVTDESMLSDLEMMLEKYPGTIWRVKPGQAGGNARAESLSPERRSEIATQAAQARWKKE